MKIRRAKTDDYQLIEDLGIKTFGVYNIREEMELIIEKGYGEVFLAYDEDVKAVEKPATKNKEGTVENNKPIAYAAILYKEFDEKVENSLQPLLRAAKKRGEKIMHDDVRFDEDKFVYIHLLGVLPTNQNQGLASELLSYTKNYADKKFPNKQLKTCIRINNLPSIKTCMKELDVCMVGLKPNNWDIIGSVETNFEAVSREGLEPVLLPIKVHTREVFDDSFPKGDAFLIPVTYGEESALKDQKLKEKFKETFENGYFIAGLFKGKELKLGDSSYFYCVKK